MKSLKLLNTHCDPMALLIKEIFSYLTLKLTSGKRKIFGSSFNLCSSQMKTSWSIPFINFFEDKKHKNFLYGNSIGKEKNLLHFLYKKNHQAFNLNSGVYISSTLTKTQKINFVFLIFSNYLQIYFSPVQTVFRKIKHNKYRLLLICQYLTKVTLMKTSAKEI